MTPTHSFFKINPRDCTSTRHGVLSTVSSLFDPFGLFAPFIVKAKMLLQEPCRIGLSWNQNVPEMYLCQWLEDVKKLDCFKPPDFSEIASIELHTFSHAHEQGYDNVSYLRFEDAEENVKVQLY